MKAVLIRIMHESRWQLSWDNSHQDYLQHPAWCEQWSEPTGKRQRAAGHCDFIDKQNKLFKICSLFNSKRLNTITGELKNHCSWLEFKASTELSHQSPPFSQQKNTHSVSNFSMASTNWFQMSLGLCYIWNKIFQLKGCAIWIWQNFLVEMCGGKYFRSNWPWKEPTGLLHGLFHSTENKKRVLYIHTSKWPKQAALLAPAETEQPQTSLLVS